jgi:uncharacterized protein YqjF (DUF2071 family)
VSAESSVFLTAAWRDLLMVSWAVDPAIVRPLAPRGTEIDVVDGRTFVSLVAFRFEDTRVLGVPIPFHRNFLEANLRFYVRRRVPGEDVRRGVVFVKENRPSARGGVGRPSDLRRELRPSADAARVATALDAKAAGHLDGSRRLTYEWRAGGRWHALRATTNGEPGIAPAGSEDAFITEHYWGYTHHRDGSTREYRVEHPRWRVWHARDVEVAGDASMVYGPSSRRCSRRRRAPRSWPTGRRSWSGRASGCPRPRRNSWRFRRDHAILPAPGKPTSVEAAMTLPDPSPALHRRPHPRPAFPRTAIFPAATTRSA